MSYQLYDALVAAGAPEEKAKAAAESIPEGQYLASKEDLQKAFGEVKVEIADLRGELKSEIANFRAAMETRFNDKFASLDRGMAVLKFAYGPIIMGLLIKLAFFD